MSMIAWTDIPIAPELSAARYLLRTPKETPYERWRRQMNAWVPSAMDTRGKHRKAQP